VTTLQVRVTTGKIAYAESTMKPQIVVTGSKGDFTGIFTTGHAKGAVKTTTFEPESDIGEVQKVHINSESGDGWFFTKIEVKSGDLDWVSVGCTRQWLDADIDPSPYWVNEAETVPGMYGTSADMTPVDKKCTAQIPALWGKPTAKGCYCKNSGKDGTCALNGDPKPWCRTRDNCAGHKSGKGNWDRCTPEGAAQGMDLTAAKKVLKEHARKVQARKLKKAKQATRLSSSQMDVWAAFQQQDREREATLKEAALADKRMATMDDATPQPVDDIAVDDAVVDDTTADNNAAADNNADATDKQVPESTDSGLSNAQEKAFAQMEAMEKQ
jgi:hypothetical protein